MVKSLAVFALVLLAGASTLRAQQTSLGEVIASAYASIEDGVEQNSKAPLMKSHSILEQALAANPGNPFVLYALSLAEYRLLVQSYVANNDELFTQYTDSAVAHLELIVSDPQMKSDACALLGSIYGMKIAKNWIKAPILGPKSSRYIEQALSADSSNPRAWFFAGVSKFSTPEFFGGSKEQAAADFGRAIAAAQHESKADSLRPHWGLADALIWSGRNAEALNDLQSAVTQYRRALEVAPNYGWVKYVLLPNAEKKLASAK